MKYYILYNEENKGPLSIEEMEEFDLNPSSRVWAPGWPSWKDASEVEEIMAYFTEREKQMAAAAAPATPQQMMQQPMMQPQQGAPMQQQAPAPPVNQPQPTYQPAQPVEPAAPSYPPQREWYMGINNRESGPFREDRLLAAGLTPDTLVWCESMPTWMTARQVPELAYLFPQPMQSQMQQAAPVVESNSDELPLNMEYEMANPWILNIVGGVLTLIAIVLFILIIADTPYYVNLSAVVSYAATPLIWLICGLISASRVSDAVNATQYILAGRRCGAARAWGWITIINAIAAVIVLGTVMSML